MKKYNFLLIVGIISLATALFATITYAGTVDQYGGSYAGWPTVWQAIPGLNDPDDGVLERLDFVGDPSDPGAYVAWDDNNLYFRQQVDSGGPIDANTYADATFIMFDSDDAGSAPDWAVAWDTLGLKSQPGKHGEEFVYPLVIGASWNQTKFQDLDGHPQDKDIPPDFNTFGDGYIRTIDGIATANFGTTTYIDYAMSWNYLLAATSYGRDTLSLTGALFQPGMYWNIQFGSAANSTDHEFISTDVAGGYNPNTTGLTYLGPIQLGDPPSPAVPEPSTITGGLIGIAFAIKKLLKRNRAG